MLEAMLVPLTVSSALALIVAAAHRRLPPALAARATAVALAVVAAAAIPTVWITGLGYLSHAPIVGGWLGWCADALGAHARVGPVVGVPALAVTVVGAWRAFVTVRRYRSLRQHHGGVEVAERDEMFAFTVPGRGGHVVISRGLHELLTEPERQVVLAHEGAHAEHRHDRYLLTGQLAAALLAPLSPLVRRLQFSLERWADEIAVMRCGDRLFVARTLGRVALCTADQQPALSFTGLGVAARMTALMAPPVDEPRSVTRAALWLLILLAGVFATFQLHHLLGMLVALCPG